MMIDIQDLAIVEKGGVPPSILALVQLGYASYPPPQLTDEGRAMLARSRSDLTRQTGTRLPDASR